MFPIRDDGIEVNWGISDITAKELLKDGYIHVGKYCPDKPQKWILSRLTEGRVNDIKSGRAEVIGHRHDGSVIAIYKDNKKRYPVSVWNKESHNAETQGSSLLSSIFSNGRFPYPKSLYAVFDCLKLFIANNPQALIVDFFAGSGTTLHAVNLLNAEDGGHRRCIMVTNNEVSEAEEKKMAEAGLKPGDKEWEKYGIARYVTWPRTACTITGVNVNNKSLNGYYGAEIERYIPDESNPKLYKKKRVPAYPELSNMRMSDGFKANAVFFKLGFLDKNAVAVGRQFKELLSTLWMKAGAHGPCPVIEDGVPDMLILPENRMAILNEENCFGGFVEQLAAHPEIDVVFLVTDYDAGFAAMTAALPGKQTYQLYRNYLDNFRINAGRNAR